MTNERTAGGAPLDPDEAALLAALRARGLNELAEMALFCFGESYGHAPTALRELLNATRLGWTIGGGRGGAGAGGGLGDGVPFASVAGIGGGGGGGTLYATPTGTNDPFVVAAQRLSEQRRQRAELHVQSLQSRARAEFFGRPLIARGQHSSNPHAIGPELIEAWYRERGVVVRADIHPHDPKNVVIDPIRCPLDDEGATP
jgi:hypothetical protein